MMQEEKTYTEIRILINEEVSDLLSNFLVEEGSGGVVLEDNQTKGNVWLVAYFPKGEDKNKLHSIHNYLDKLKELGLKVGGVKVQTKEVKQEEWPKNWRKGFKSIFITDRIVIQPPWEKEKLAGKTIIKINPQMAFGTGEHSTSKLCIKSLEKFIKDKDRVLDVGTGSGILAITAARLGASYVLALDIDPLALENAKENIKLNRVQKEIELKSGTVNHNLPKNSFDIVVANLDKSAIIRLFEQMKETAKKNAIFILSGILDKEEEEVKNHLKKMKVKFSGSSRDEEWSCIVAQG